MGENGAGKSTLMHILAGVHHPDGGSLEWDGREFAAFADEHDALRAGIAIVFQERSLFGPLSIAENIFAARQPVGRWGLIDRRELRRRSLDLLARVGLDADPEMPVERLSPAQQQLVEVAKALSIEARLIIFDEPTAALTAAEAARLFAVIRRLRERQLGVIYISHRLEEVFQIADRVTVLKDGSGEGTFPIGRVTARRSRRADGRARPRPSPAAAPMSPPTDSPIALEVRGLSDADDATGGPPRFRDITFRVRCGRDRRRWPGWSGPGAPSWRWAIFGARPGVTGEVRVNGRRVDARSPAEAITAGIGYLTEDRKDDGLFLEMSIADNILAVNRRHSAPPGDMTTGGGGPRPSPCAARSASPAAVRTSRSGTSAAGTSRRWSLAKWLRAGPAVLIVDEPTRGVDVGAKAEIHQLLFGWRPGHGRGRHLLRPAGGAGRGRPHPGHARGPPRRRAGPRRGHGGSGHGARRDGAGRPEIEPSRAGRRKPGS